MKIILDENLPPAMARALNELFNGKHEITHMKLRFKQGISDIDWISELNADGKWIVLTADRHIFRNKAEKQAFKRSRLIAFVLSPSLQKASTLKKMERLMAVWETIEKQVPLALPGSAFEIQIRGAKTGSL